MFLPVAGMSRSQLNDTFGADRDGGSRSHRGIDIFAKTGTPVVAVRGGVVVKAGEAGKGGIRAWVKDDQGFYHYYAHMNMLSVQAGQRVEAGQQIGGVGDTGNAKGTPPHLHYSVNFGAGTQETDGINPYNFLMGNRSDTLEVSDLQAQVEGPSTQFGPPTFERQRQGQSSVMAGIMASVSAAASSDGEGRILDMNALMGGASFNAPDQELENI